MASTVHKLLHNILVPAQSANTIPTLTNNSLISTRKFVDAGYTIVYEDKEFNYYEKATTKIIVSEDVVLGDGNAHATNCGMSHLSLMFET